MFQYWPDGLAGTRSWNYQLYRLIAEAQFGGGDFGEIHRTAKRIRVGNVEDWYAEWTGTASHVEELGLQAVASGRNETAAPHLLRAFSYHRSAEFYLAFDDPRRLQTYGRAMDCFRRAMTLLDPAPQPIEVPYENTTLAGYLFPPETPISPPWPVVFFLSGADALPEENYFRGVRFITRRGAACVCVNCPGQGSAIRLQSLHTRPDYEKPVGAVLDVLCARPDIDARRVGMLAESMGGYYGPRAAAFDKRIRVLVICGALFDVLSDLYEPYPAIRDQLRWITGADSEDSARDLLKAFTLATCVDRVDQPTLIVHGEEDQLVPARSAQKTYDGLRGEKQMRIYAAADGGAMHGQMDNRSENIPFMVDWLLQRL